MSTRSGERRQLSLLSITAILARCFDRCLAIGFFLLEGGLVVDMVVGTDHVDENKKGVRESGTGVGLHRKLDPERHEEKDPTRVLPRNVGNRSRYLHCASLRIQWRCALLLASLRTRQRERSVTVFEETQNCRGHVFAPDSVSVLTLGEK